jgi:cytochrome b subunit of formate dehydrogenase
MQRMMGYLMFVIAALIPGILISRVDNTPMGIGSVYYVAMAVLILAYNAMGLYCNQE